MEKFSHTHQYIEFFHWMISQCRMWTSERAHNEFERDKMKGDSCINVWMCMGRGFVCMAMTLNDVHIRNTSFAHRIAISKCIWLHVIYQRSSSFLREILIAFENKDGNEIGSNWYASSGYSFHLHWASIYFAFVYNISIRWIRQCIHTAHAFRRTRLYSFFSLFTQLRRQPEPAVIWYLT